MKEHESLEPQSAAKRALMALEKMQARLRAAEAEKREPVAILGMAGRFPGANSLHDFWTLLQTGQDAIVEVPSDRWDIDRLYDASGSTPGRMNSRWGGFISEPYAFDSDFFGISPREALYMDPQHRLLLELTWEALEDAGIVISSLSRSPSGVFVGISNSDYGWLLSSGSQHLNIYSGTGNSPSIAAGRIAYQFDLRGPAVAVDTACSSSLTALHLACSSLRSRESDLAIVAGVNLMFAPTTTICASNGQMMARDGRCKTFDARADGFVRAEGCGVIVLKRLGDVSGEPIRAIIRGSAVNQDGRSAGLTAPNLLAQQAVIWQALKNADISPSRVSLIEAHGTGTPLGDPIEVEALRDTYGRENRRYFIGSVKTNLGHLEAAAGIAGLTKVVLALQSGQIPPHLNFQQPNPNIAFDDLPFDIPTQLTPWPVELERRCAAISSFGWAGTNVHVVLEEAPSPNPQPLEVPSGPWPLLVSARSSEALRASLQSWDAYLDAHSTSLLRDLCFSAACHRDHHPYRVGMVASSVAEMRSALQLELLNTNDGGKSVRSTLESTVRIVFVFPGQGAQWLGMGADLFQISEAFRSAFQRCDYAIQDEVGWSVVTELLASASTSRLIHIEVVQPLLFALQVALSAWWRDLGLEPSAVVGHSMGEVAAAHIAGILSLEDAVAVICRRSLLLREVAGKGAMLMVELEPPESAELLRGLEDRVSIAVNNSVRNTVLSGAKSALTSLVPYLEERSIFHRWINVDVASHSPQMDPLKERLLDALKHLRPRSSPIHFYSTVSGQPLDGSLMGADYWMQNLRQPVLFAKSIEELVRADYRHFIEISPSPLLMPALQMMFNHIAQSEPSIAGRCFAVGSLKREREARQSLLESAVALHCRGVDIPWTRTFPPDSHFVPIPTYRWQHKSYRVEVSATEIVLGSPQSTDARRPSSSHPWLRSRITVAAPFNTHIFEGRIGLQDSPFLADHRLGSERVFPGTGFLELMVYSGAQVLPDLHWILLDVRFESPLILSDHSDVTVRVIVGEKDDGSFRIQVSTRPTDSDDSFDRWTFHAEARLEPSSPSPIAPTVDPFQLRQRSLSSSSAADFYSLLQPLGHHYGPFFAGVEQIWTGERFALARIRPSGLPPGASFSLNPATLDACFHALAGVWISTFGDEAQMAMVPVGYGLVRVRRAIIVTESLWSYVKLSAPVGSTSTVGSIERDAEAAADLSVWDSKGNMVLEVSDIRLSPASSTADRHRFRPEWTLQRSWISAPLPAVSEELRRVGKSFSCLILDGDSGIGSHLARELQFLSARCVRILGDVIFSQNDPSSPRANPEGSIISNLQARLTPFLADEKPVHEIIYCTMFDQCMAPNSSSADLWERQRIGVVALAGLLGAVGTLGWRNVPQCTVITGSYDREDAVYSDLVQSPLVGLLMAVLHEYPRLQCRQIQVRLKNSEGFESVCREILLGRPENVVRLDGQMREVARIRHQKVIPPDAPKIREAAHGRPFILLSAPPGVLEHLALHEHVRLDPAPHEVRIRVHLAGLNFLDVLLALGVITTDRKTPPSPSGYFPPTPVLGGECLGEVEAVGAAVANFVIGQRVLAFATPAFASHLVVDSALAFCIPENFPSADAATVPSSYLTAWYALVTVARLKPGERILIHSASGGVGLAAIHVANFIGAEVLATAGSEVKRQYLRELGITCVADSRSLSFSEDVRSFFGGTGVDVVLNSLSGPFIARSLELLRDFGRFIEIGKRDYLANRPVGLKPLLRNASFSIVDLRNLLNHHPKLMRSTFEDVLDHIWAGHLSPIPHTIWPVSRAQDAFREMAGASHIGKILLDFSDPVAEITPSTKALQPEIVGTVLITGGLGGIGRKLAVFLASSGWKSIVLTSRRAVCAQENESITKQLAAMGVIVAYHDCDVADEASVEKLMTEIHRTLPPLKAVYHCAGTLDDHLIEHLDEAHFRSVMAPKVLGAWNLHRYTLRCELEHFVMFSSASALIGSPGQANYAAANAFLDALAEMRHSSGLPATSIGWGPWLEVGLAAVSEQRGARVSGTGVKGISPDQAWAALDVIARAKLPYAAVVPIDVRQFREHYLSVANTPVFSLLTSPLTSGSNTPLSSVVAALRDQNSEGRLSLVASFVREQLCAVLRLPPSRLQPDEPFGTLGIDSLLSLEIRNRMEAGLGLRLSTTVLFAYPTIKSLALHLLSRLVMAENAEANGKSSVSGQEPDPVPPPNAVLQPELTNEKLEAPVGQGSQLDPPSTDSGSQVVSRAEIIAEHPHRATTASPIAIVGVGCRLPGGIVSADAFWDFLERGGDAVTLIPPQRRADGTCYDPNAVKSGDTSITFGAFLSRIDTFDASFFGISPREAEKMDPQQRLLLEVTFEALEDAGVSLSSGAGLRTGVFVGACNFDYSHLLLTNLDNVDVYAGTGNSPSVLAGRISYSFDFQGPCISTDTACSSSLVATHLACRSLISRECDTAVVGGVNVIISPQTAAMACSLQALSPDGSCKTFDARANGFVRGEGCVVLILKRLEDALSPRDRVYALIHGSAVNQDGRSVGLTAPNLVAQETVLRDALAAGGISARQVNYIETHGTGTPLGDPIEVEALSRVYNDPIDVAASMPVGLTPCYLGSVKTNVGHLEGAAGVVGVLRAALALRAGKIPGNCHFESLNPRIQLAETRFRISAETAPWPNADSPRYAAVSSFGVSGTNSHAILSAPRKPPAQGLEHLSVASAARVGVSERPADELFVLPVSARDREVLSKRLKQWADYLEKVVTDEQFADFVYTASLRRNAMPIRAALVASSRLKMTEQLRQLAYDRGDTISWISSDVSTQAAAVIFVFPGQGSQWSGMCQALYAKHAAFRASIERSHLAMLPFLERPLLETFLAPTNQSQSLPIDQIQPLLFAIEVAFADLLIALGVRCAGVIGHSMGEIAAACVAGALSLEDAARIVCRRSRLLKRISGLGAMLMVELTLEHAEAEIADVRTAVSVAVNNGPRATVLSGDRRVLESIRSRLEHRHVFARWVNVDVASHSPQVDSLRTDLRQQLAGIVPQKASVPVFSTVMGRLSDGTEFDVDYWIENLRAPVLFADAVKQALHAGHLTFVELSPHPILVSSIEQMLRHENVEGRAHAVLVRNDDGGEALYSTLAALYVHGATLDLSSLIPGQRSLMSIPPYPWRQERHWIQPTKITLSAVSSASVPGLRTDPESDHNSHPLLGLPFHVANESTAFQTRISRELWPLLLEHQVQGVPVVPGAAYLGAFLSVGHALIGASPLEILDTAFHETLGLPDEKAVTLQTLATNRFDGRRHVSISSSFSGVDAGGTSPSWRRHASAMLSEMRREPPDIHLDMEFLVAIGQRCSSLIDSEVFYAETRARGVLHGPAFRRLGNIRRGKNEAIAEIVGGATGEVGVTSLIDACLQLGGVAAPEEIRNRPGTWLPTGIARLRSWSILSELQCAKDIRFQVYCRTELTRNAGAPEQLLAHLELFDSQQRRWLSAEGVTFTYLAPTVHSSDTFDRWLYEIQWKPFSIEASEVQARPSGDGARLVFCDETSLTEELVMQWRERGMTVVQVRLGNRFQQRSELDFELGVEDASDWTLLFETLRMSFPSGFSSVLYLWSLLPTAHNESESDTIQRAQEVQVKHVVRFIKTTTRCGWRDQPRLYFVTRNAQGDIGHDAAVGRGTKESSVNVFQSLIWGLARTIAHEHPEFRITGIDLETSRHSSEVVFVQQEVDASSEENQVACRLGLRLVARLAPLNVQHDTEGLRNRSGILQSATAALGYRLESLSPGRLDRIKLLQAPRVPPGPDEVEVEVTAGGLNFNDVMKAMGVYPGAILGQIPIGGECSGRIVRVGSGSPYDVGERVIAMGAWCFASHVTVKQQQVIVLPETMSFEEGATIPAAFITAWYALHSVGRMQAGESVLIHSASGGVGLAAIQLARHVGVAVFATGGTEEKRAFLRQCGIGHVMDSRSLDFVETIRELTGGKGVDLVLNSLSGEGLSRSFLCLAPYGRFLDLSKRDIYHDNKLAMLPFRNNLSYFAIDVSRLHVERPGQYLQLVADVQRALHSRRIQPLPYRAVQLEHAEEAFRDMAQARHIGKLVLTTTSAPVPLLPLPPPFVRKEGCYLISGGLGGIGLELARYLAENGAGTLVLCSRNAGSAAVEKTLSDLAAYGARILNLPVDIADSNSVHELFLRFGADLPTLHGVFHCAMVLRDATLLNIRDEHIGEVLAPKVLGAWNLHRETASLTLDTFVLFSSGASILGSPGQSIYGAANAFLDSLAAHRRSQGLAGLSISWGPWKNVGQAAASDSRGVRMAQQGMLSISVDPGMQLLSTLIGASPAHIGVMPLQLQQWREYYVTAAKLPLLRDLSSDTNETDRTSSALELDRIRLAPSEARRALLETYLRDQIARVLRLSTARILDQTPFGSIGLDSLMGLEIRNRLDSAFGTTLPSTLLWTYPTIRHLADYLEQELQLFSDALPASATVAPVSSTDGTALRDEVAALSEDEAARQLLAELADWRGDNDDA